MKWRRFILCPNFNWSPVDQRGIVLSIHNVCDCVRIIEVLDLALSNTPLDMIA